VIVHLIGRDMFNSVLATFGIAIILQQLMARASLRAAWPRRSWARPISRN
jgi:branched-subunit amino acid ABC-type transport system permease component